MCGIAGFSLTEKDNTDARKLARSLLLEIVKRGKDATGMSWVEADGATYYYKNNTTAWRFVREALSVLPKDAKTVILHTRYATKGSPTVEENNHPIIRPGIVGVHNGTISNDDEMFDMLNAKRYGEVDSEAAFALLDESGMHPTDSLTLLDGRVALAWINTDSPDALHLARLRGSPLAIGQTTRGSLIFASTLVMLVNAGIKMGFTWSMAEEVAEGWYFRVKAGVVHDTLRIGVPSQMDTVLTLIGGK